MNFHCFESSKRKKHCSHSTIFENVTFSYGICMGFWGTPGAMWLLCAPPCDYSAHFPFRHLENITFLEVVFFDSKSSIFPRRNSMWRKVTCFVMVSASKPDHMYNGLKHFQKIHVCKNIAFFRNYQKCQDQVTGFASQTLYRWSFSDVENGRAVREIN